MFPFENYLQDIAYEVRSPNDSFDFSEFQAVKNYVLEVMSMVDSYFGEICQSNILFGSAAHNIRLYDDDEYDVLMELRFPAHSDIVQVLDCQRPGFMYLDFSDAICDDMVNYSLANNQSNYLNRDSLNRWLHSIIRDALNKYGNVVYTSWDEYVLTYTWRGFVYNIFAQSSSRSFAIDFVPAIKIESWKSKTFYAIPKAKAGPGNTANFTFQISNSQAEWRHVNRCGESMKDALRLIRALCDAKQLRKIRYYHLVNVAIWLARLVGHNDVSSMSVTEVFLLLLNDLCKSFIEGHLPFVWDSNMNLLNGFTSAQMSHYTNELCLAFNTLKTYPDQLTLSYRRCVAHFQQED